MSDFEIIFYEKEDSSVPAREFLLSLDTKMRAKLMRLIEVLKVKGNEIREPFSKSLGDGIFKLRARVGTDISWVFYFFLLGRNVILTNGFIKKTNKTPEEELDRAKRY